MTRRWTVIMFAVPLVACQPQIDEASLLRPIPGGALPAALLAQAAPAYAMSEHMIPAPDGARLSAVWLRQPGARATILYFGGNGYTIERFGAMTARQFASLGVDLMIVDHRGYGRSEGVPTQASMDRDGVAAFDYLTATLGVAPGSVVVHGQSLGSFIAGRVAAERTAGGVVLESSATTTEDWVDANLGGVTRLVVRPRIADSLRGRGNLSNMPRIEEPLLILVGARDRTTPPRLSQALYAASPLAEGRKRIAVIEGADHNNVMDQPRSIEAYASFLAALR